MSGFFNRRRNARGAVAVIVAFSCTLFFVLAAIGVDLGNAMGRKKQVQTSADFSALAAGASLPVTGSPQASDAAVIAAADYLNKDQPIDDSKTCDQSKTCVTPADLVDANLDNGHIEYLGSTTLRVTAPRNRINFSLAQVIGAKSVDVKAQATVGIFSPGQGIMPVYAVAGCDWGTQVLTDPANGQATPNVPPLEFPTDNGVATLTSLSVTQVNVGATGTLISIAGSKLDGGAAARAQFTRVGFFRGTSSTPSSFLDIVPTANPTDNFLQFALPNPATFTAIEDVWWVRVRTQNQQGENRWSPMAEALPFRVGEAVLECAGSSNDGNFGSLLLPRIDIANNSANAWLAANMAVGLQEPLTLHTYDGNVPANGQCAPGPSGTNAPFIEGPGDNQTRYSPSGSASTTADLVDRTNCVDTDSGLPANAVTNGMIKGLGNAVAPKGRLRDKPTTCGPGNGTTSRTVSLNNTNYTINNDMLTCYFLDNSVTVSDVSRPNYTYNSGAKSISDDIYSSPRFFYVPVLRVEPVSGGSNHYYIIDFRPAFLTGNLSGATKQSPGVTVNDDNGLIIQNNDVKSMRVVFVNQAAIEVPEGGPVTPYIGRGEKLVRLIN